MVIKLQATKLRKKKASKHNRTNFPQFLSANTYSINSINRPKHLKRNYGRRLRQHVCRVHIRHKAISELPKRQNVRIRQAINQSIKSHINRLADYRFSSNMKSADTCCPLGTCPYPKYSSPCVLSTPNQSVSSYNHLCQRKSMPGTSKTATRTCKKLKREKNKKERELKTIDLQNFNAEGSTLESDVKKVTELIKNFEKQKQEFLSSLSKIHAQVSNLRIPMPSLIKCKSQNEVRRHETNKAKIEKISQNLNIAQKFNPVNIKSIASTSFAKTRTKKGTLALPHTKSPKLQKLKGSVMDNLSKLLMNTAQRPTTTRDNGQDLNLGKLSQIPNVKGLPLQGGLMNLAQTFCSMATGF